MRRLFAIIWKLRVAVMAAVLLGIWTAVLSHGGLPSFPPTSKQILTLKKGQVYFFSLDELKTYVTLLDQGKKKESDRVLVTEMRRQRTNGAEVKMIILDKTFAPFIKAQWGEREWGPEIWVLDQWINLEEKG